MMRRLLILEALTGIAGGQAALLSVLPALTEAYQVQAIVPGAGPLAQALQSAGVSLHTLHMADYQLVSKSRADLLRFVLDTPRLTWAAYRVLRRQPADVIYANNSRAFVWGTLAARLAHHPIVWHVHNVFGDGKTLAILRRLVRWPIVKCVIGASQPAIDQFQLQADKLCVIPTGVDLDRFAPQSSAAVRNEFGLTSDQPVVGLIGDLIPLKGQRTFIDAITTVRQRVPGVRGWIIGAARPGLEGEAYEAELRAAAHDQPIDFLGRREYIERYLNALDVLVVASTTETGPLVLLEALACGVPVVSTPVGRAPELLNDATCGQLFPVGDAAALADQLSQLLPAAAQRAALSHAARRRAIEQLSLTQYRTRIIAAIQAAVTS
jgi:glycosyltransferase involved in cell wall biosynthesis